MNKVFEIKNLKFNYNHQQIFNNLSLTQNRSDIVLWAGPSGSGKSSLAKIICSHLTAPSGELKVFNTTPAKASLDRLYVCHENDLFQWQTLEEHIHFLIQNLVPLKNITQAEVDIFTDILEIKDLMKKYPSQISMGEIRRFQILRSLILKSKFVVFDETFSALDSKLKNRIMPKLLQIWKSAAISVIIISHETDTSFNIKFDQHLDFQTLDFATDKK